MLKAIVRLSCSTCPWEEIVALLEEIEEMEAEDRQQILKAVAESRQAYQTGQVKRGTAADLIADLNE